MRNLVRATLVMLFTLFVAGAAAPLTAQDIRPLGSASRQGFWWGLGLGIANAKLDCDQSGCSSLKKYNFGMGDIHVGFTPSPKLALGLQITGGQRDSAFLEDPSIKEIVGDVNVSAYFYPQASGNFFLQGGLASVVWRAKQGSNWDRLVAPGVTVGAGYDFRFGRNASITPVIRGVFSSKHALTDQGGGDPAPGSKWNLSFVHLGVSVIWH